MEVLLFKNEVRNILNSFLTNYGFISLDIPIILKQKYSNASNQFTLEMALYKYEESNLFYVLVPAFRLELLDPKRCLSEFWMLEIEMGCDFHGLIKFIRQFWSYILIEGTKKYWKYLSSEKLAYLESIDNYTIPIISYSTAIKKLRKQGIEIEYGESIIEYEKLLAENGPIMIIFHPLRISSFYMKRYKNTVLSISMLLPEVGELLCGGQREDNYSLLKSRLLKRDANMNTYLNLRKSNVIHSGFRLGFERLIMFLLGTNDIRSTVF